MIEMYFPASSHDLILHVMNGIVNSVNQPVTWDPRDMGGRGSKGTESCQMCLAAFVILSLFGKWQDSVRR